MSGRRDDTDDTGRGVTRRGFLGGVGAGAVAAAAGLAGREAAALEITDPDAMIRVALSINGRVRHLLVEPRWSLLFVVRDLLGLTGTKVGCERGECGACTVLIDDQPRYACMTLAVEAEGHAITTLEGLLEGEALGSTQQAFLEHDAFQCGYCTPGQIMAAEGLLRATPQPDDAAIRHGMSGNLCRCGAYVHIVKAVDTAAKLRKSGGAK
jgi:xanthine dehydrogenase YagT iron-sulfur-binding subunit